MRRRNQLAILVAMLAVSLVGGASRASTRVETDSDTKAETSNSTATVKKSPRVFVNTSVPFSVAPQPVKDTNEVAQAKQQFMSTFRRIQDAVIAADTDHFNVTVLEDDIPNNLDDLGSEGASSTTTTTSTTSKPPTPIQGRTSFVHRGPGFLGPVDSGPKFSIFPDPILEPEYFLPSVHVDPLLMQQLHPPLPPHPFIQQIRPISDPGLVGTCYEIMLLEPEEEFFQFNRGNASNDQGSVTFPSHGSLLDAIAGPAVEGRTRSNRKSSSASQVIPVGTPAVPGASFRNPVAHFKAPQLSFLSLLQGGGATPTGR